MVTSAREAHSIACKLGTVSREIGAAVNRLLAEHEVTSTQASLFFYLSQGEDSPSKIARLVGVDASNLSRLLGTLHKRGLVERSIDPEHRSRIQVRLTPEGEALAEAIDPHAAIVQQAITAAVSDAELQALVGTLHKISDAVSKLGEE